MKNEQQNNQNGKQDQSVNQQPVNNERNQPQQPKKDDWTNGSTGKNQPQSKTNQPYSPSQGNEKSNISVNNEGKIGKSHEQWNNDNNNRNGETEQGNQKENQQLRSDKTITEPEIDAPIYDPEKTEKKIPQMGSNKNSK